MSSPGIKPPRGSGGPAASQHPLAHPGAGLPHSDPEGTGWPAARECWGYLERGCGLKILLGDQTWGCGAETKRHPINQGAVKVQTVCSSLTDLCRQSQRVWRAGGGAWEPLWGVRGKEKHRRSPAAPPAPSAASPSAGWWTSRVWRRVSSQTGPDLKTSHTRAVLVTKTALRQLVS